MLTPQEVRATSTTTLITALVLAIVVPPVGLAFAMHQGQHSPAGARWWIQWCLVDVVAFLNVALVVVVLVKASGGRS